MINKDLLFLKKYKDVEGSVKIEDMNGEVLVKKFAAEMEEMLGRKMESVKVTVAHLGKSHGVIANDDHAVFYRRGSQKQQKMQIFPTSTTKHWRYRI